MAMLKERVGNESSEWHGLNANELSNEIIIDDAADEEKTNNDQITGLPQRHLSARVCIMAQRRSVPHLLAGPPDKGKHHSHDDDASNSSATSLRGLTVRLSWAQSKAVCMERGRRGGQPGWRLGLCRWTKEDGA